jgi:hypothetical protein
MRTALFIPSQTICNSILTNYLTRSIRNVYIDQYQVSATLLQNPEDGSGTFLHKSVNIYRTTRRHGTINLKFYIGR